MAQRRWFLGVDGGGTKTHCALYDLMSGTLDLVTAGPGNHEVLADGFDGLRAALDAMLLPLLKRNCIAPADVTGAAFGLGGVDTPAQHATLSQMLRAMGFPRFALANDAFLGVKAECKSGFGIGAVNGSGYSVVGMNPSGDLLQIGGNGDWTGDKGGACFYLPKVISAAYAELFKGGAHTALTDKLSALLDMPPRALFMQALMQMEESDEAAFSLALSKLLYEAASEGDAVALSILDESGRDYALSISVAARSLSLPPPVEVALLGSHFKQAKSKRVIETLQKELEKDVERRYILRVITTHPVAGALLWALELGGEKGGQEAMDRMHDTLHAHMGGPDA